MRLQRPLVLLTALLCAEHAAAQLPAYWDRDNDWTIPPDAAHGTTQGNPAPDMQGHLVYHYEYVTTGGGLGTANPWYLEPTTPLTWDKSWYGSEGGWSVGDNFGCVMRPGSVTHPGQWPGYVPIVRWRNTTGQKADVDLTGMLWIGWSGDFQSAYPVDVDYVVGLWDAGSGTTVVLQADTLIKPTQDNSVEAVPITLDILGLRLDPGDEIFWTLRGWESTFQGKWVTMNDRHLNLVQRPVGDDYCGPAEVNSRGIPAQLLASGSTSVVDDALTLKAVALPYNQFGMFLTSQSQGFAQNPGGSQGNLCLSGNIGRFNGQIFNTMGMAEATLPVDLSSVPTPSGPVAIQPGETWNFQAWYRDLPSTSNFTDAISITFE
ncbi:MAG: hypothetical protein O2816_16370 [Planctomycetota bacterium]|nr:hypothetical protein [Planctomycetota bacterium]